MERKTHPFSFSFLSFFSSLISCYFDDMAIILKIKPSSLKRVGFALQRSTFLQLAHLINCLIVKNGC